MRSQDVVKRGDTTGAEFAATWNWKFSPLEKDVMQQAGFQINTHVYAQVFARFVLAISSHRWV